MYAASSVLTPEQRVEVAKKAEAFHADGGWRGRMHERFGGERFFKSQHRH